MPGHDARGPVLDLEDLDPHARAWVERLVTSGSLVLRERGEQVGTIAFEPASPAEPALRPGTKVLATTMDLRPEARERLRQAFGPEWVVLDFHDAPPTADVVLTAAHSPQLINRWTLMFPDAQVIITEILDDELGLDVSGPVGRLMDAGADAYLPPRPLQQVAANVQAYLESRARAAIDAPAPVIQQIGS